MDSIFPELAIEDIDTLTTEDSPEKLGRSFLFNDITKKFEFANGRNIEADENQAIRQWITLILRAYKDKVNIYKDTDFNCNVEDLIGQKLNNFTESELKREITESLLRNAFIVKVDNFILKQIKRNLNVEFDVTLKNNETLNISEVI